MKKVTLMSTLFCVTGLVDAALADINVCTDPSYCGTDGSLIVSENTEIQLSLAASLCDCDGAGMLDDECRWDCPSPVPGQGVYDAEQWAVVFKYTSVTVQAATTVTFENHPSGAPVVWLVDGAVVIEGDVDLNGGNGNNGGIPRHALPGPGGFRGGIGGATRGGGFGPGGAERASNNGSGGSYGTPGAQGGAGGGSVVGPTYGNDLILPLIGGSGGAGGSTNTGGGAGGGALLLATNTTITLNGQIRAVGGNGANTGSYDGGDGSGGGLRLVADVFSGNGFLRANGGNGSNNGGNGGSGRIRVEANDATGFVDSGIPEIIAALPSDPVQLWPDALSPRIVTATLAGQSISTDPAQGIYFPDHELFIADSDPLTLVIEAMNIPVPTLPGIPCSAGDVCMEARVVKKTGQDFVVQALYVSGNLVFSTWEAEITLPGEISAIQVRAELP